MNSKIKQLYDHYKSHPKVCTDSRKVEKGAIFFALKGPNFNGNEYAKSALAKGAALAVVDEEKWATEKQMFLVKNVLQTLQDLSTYHREQLDIPVVGITGSNGKTTTKELIKCVLSKKYNVLATTGNLNNHIGVPLTLLNINATHEIAIIEMGSNGKGEIESLSQICKPDMGLITSIGKAHLEGFKNIEGVLEEKTALYRSLAKRDKVVFYNQFSSLLPSKLPSNTENISYSFQGSYAFEYEGQCSFPKIKGTCKRGENKLILESEMYGEYNVTNIIAALTIGEYFNVDLEKGLLAIKEYLPSNNRSENKRYNGAEIFLDAYNANPSSVSLVLNEFSNLKGNKILILGDMLEVGKNEIEEHLNILNSIDPDDFVAVLLLGSLYSEHSKAFPDFKFSLDFDDLNIQFSELNIEGKKILMKGSRGMGLERLIK